MPFSFDATVFISPTQFSRMVYGVADGTVGKTPEVIANTEFLVNTAASTILGYIDRSILLAECVETFDGQGSDLILLREGPVLDVTSLRISGDGDFATKPNLMDQNALVVWNPEGDVSLRGGTFPRGRSAIQITYSAGYALEDVPYDLRAALVQQFKWLHQTLNAGSLQGGSWLGVASRSKMGESESKDSTIGEHGMPREVLGWLRKYKRMECPSSIGFMRTT